MQLLLYVSRRELTPAVLSTLTLPPEGVQVENLPRVGDEAWRSLTVRLPRVLVKVRHQTRTDADLAGHTRALCTHVVRHQPNIDDQTVELLKKINRTRHLLQIDIEPGIDVTGQAQRLVQEIARRTDGLVHYAGCVFDPELNCYWSPAGRTDPDARLPIPRRALDRKAVSEDRLRQMDIVVPRTLPVVVPDEEVVLRPAGEVARRAMVLRVVADCAKSKPNRTGVALLWKLGLWENATNREQQFLLSDAPDEREAVALAWRHESLWALLWAMGYVNPLGPPATMMRQQNRIRAAMSKSEPQEMIDHSLLRVESDILNELDFTYRVHWAVRDAQAHDREPPPSVNPNVVAERFQALTWLTSEDEAEWESVSTDV
jgi:Domain of unknown function (DUF4272)